MKGKFPYEKGIGDVAVEEMENRLNNNVNVRRMLSILHENEYITALLEHTNTVVIGRLEYNDHGITHSKITANNALKILELLYNANILPNIIKEGTGNYEDAQLTVMTGAYLHDIGNSVHRQLHYSHGMFLVNEFLDETLNKLYPGRKKSAKIKAMIPECIYTHDEAVQCISVEGGCVTVGDGTDMATGRARVPFKKGKIDIHSVSALSIDKVEITKGIDRPVRIEVFMSCSAGIFQIQDVFGKKLKSSGIQDYIEIFGTVSAKEKERIVTKIEF